MICPECLGVGRIQYGEEWCSACDGTGEVKKTNFEDITSSPERLAEFLENLKNFCTARDCKDCPFVLDACIDKGWLEWMEQEADNGNVL